MQRLVLAIGGFAVLVASFLGTLHLLDSFNFQSLDSIRIEHAKSLKAALEVYYTMHGKFPSPYPDSEIKDLRAPLVESGIISQLPIDPYWKNGRVNKYRYRSLDGSMYGLLFYMELGPCQTGVGAAATDPWGGRRVTTCPF